MATPEPAGAQSALTLESASQAKNLDQIGALAEGLESPTGGPGSAPGAALAPAQNPLALSNAATIESALLAARDGFCQFTKLHAPRQVATKESLHELAMGWGTWCASRHYDLKTYMGKHADTIPLVLSTAMLAFAVYEATRMEIAARKPTDVTARPSEGDADGGAVQQ